MIKTILTLILMMTSFAAVAHDHRRDYDNYREYNRHHLPVPPAHWSRDRAYHELHYRNRFLENQYRYDNYRYRTRFICNDRRVVYGQVHIRTNFGYVVIGDNTRYHGCYRY